jgi:uncharacterized damage-inducible protein DinB
MIAMPAPENASHAQKADETLPAREFGWWHMWASPEDDPRQDGGFEGERELLVGYLRNYRLTLELKCAGLDAEQLARRSVPPSNMSLLGLVRHMATVEQAWFRVAMAGVEVPRLYRDGGEEEFDAVVADPAMVEEACARWREEIAFAEGYVERTEDLATVGAKGDVLREVLLHMIEEYARHCGHADFLRERIDGRVGQ